MKTTHISYQTTDQVNLVPATDASRKCGESLNHLAGPPARAFAAMQHDLDNVHSQCSRAVVDKPVSRPATFSLAVHSYKREHEATTVLHADGVIVSREINAELVREPGCATERSKTAAPEHTNCNSQEASDDPAVLCGIVRSLAAHAHRAMRRRPVGARNIMPGEMSELRERINQFQQHLDRFRRQDQRRFAGLQRWLDSLRRCVENLLAQAPQEIE